MAFVDLLGGTSGGVEGPLDVTHRRFEPVEHELLPRGLAWDPEDPVRRSLVAAQMTELSRVDVRAGNLERELDPNKTFALIDDWEQELGLPECVKPVTLEARRAAVVAKLLAEAGHNQSWVWWKGVLEALGYPPHFFLSGVDVMKCNDPCTDVLTDEEWMYVWQIFVDLGLDDALLQCFVVHNAWIATLPIVHFMWRLVEVDLGAHHLYGVAVTAKGYMAAVGAAGHNFHAGAEYDEPDGWTAGTQQLEDLYAVAGVGKALVACGVNPVNFVRSLDNGATWTASGDATSEMYAITKGLGDGVVVAAGEDGDTWRSVDYGQTWTQVAAPAAEAVQGLTHCTGAVVAVTAAGNVFRSANNGTSWTAVGSSGGPALRGVGAWQKIVVAVGDDGVILRSDDAGVSFSAVTSPTTSTLRAVAGTPAKRWTAVGDSGLILHSFDDGVTWDGQKGSPTNKDLYAVTMHVPSGRAVIVGADSTIILE